MTWLSPCLADYRARRRPWFGGHLHMARTSHGRFCIVSVRTYESTFLAVRASAAGYVKPHCMLDSIYSQVSFEPILICIEEDYSKFSFRVFRVLPFPSFADLAAHYFIGACHIQFLIWFPGRCNLLPLGVLRQQG